MIYYDFKRNFLLINNFINIYIKNLTKLKAKNL